MFSKQNTWTSIFCPSLLLVCLAIGSWSCDESETEVKESAPLDAGIGEIDKYKSTRNGFDLTVEYNDSTKGISDLIVVWSEVENATAYKLYWSTSTPVTKESTVVELTDSSYVLSNISAGTYYFRVLYLVEDYISELSDEVSFNAGFRCVGDALSNGSSFPNGDGSEVAPYSICTADQFNLISTDIEFLNKHYVIQSNLDFNDLSVSFSMIGDSTNPFIGTLDGGNHHIENFNLTVSSGDNVGLFGKIAETVDIQNLTLVSPTVTASNSEQVGILAGDGGGIVKNIKITNGTVTGAKNVGGLIGDIQSCSEETLIENIDIEVTVKAPEDTGWRFTGGLAGKFECGTINRATVSGTVWGATVVGGIVGKLFANSTLSNSRFTGEVRGYKNGGGVIGQFDGGTAFNCFTSSDVIQNSNSVQSMSPSVGVGTGGSDNIFYNSDMKFELDDGGSLTINSGDSSTPLNTMEITDITKFTGWDFTNIWTMGELMPEL
jgi:hypothetical protein